MMSSLALRSSLSLTKLTLLVAVVAVALRRRRIFREKIFGIGGRWPYISGHYPFYVAKL